MTSFQAFYCTNEKGKCEKIFFCNYQSDRTTPQALGSRIFVFFNFINNMCIYNVYEPV